MSTTDDPVVENEPPDDDVAIGESPDGDRLGGDQARWLLTNRRKVLIGLGTLGSIAAIAEADLGGSGGGNLYGGTMALDKAYKVGERSYLGPESLKDNVISEIPDSEGWEYRTSDTNVRFWLDNNAWQGPVAVGSSSTSVPAVHTDKLPNTPDFPDGVTAYDLLSDYAWRLRTEYDSRARLRTIGNSLDNFEGALDGTGKWGLNTGQSLSADTSIVYTGSQSAKVEKNTSNTYAQIRWTPSSALDLSGKSFSLAFNTDRGDFTRLQLELQAPDNVNRVFYRAETYSGELNSNGRTGWYHPNWGITSTEGTPDMTSVSDIFIRFQTGDTNTGTFWVDDLRTIPKLDSGYVLLKVSDANDSAYNKLYPATKKYGYPATVGVAVNEVGTSSSLSQSQMDELAAAGWDMMNETETHPSDMTALSDSEVRDELSGGKQWLMENGFERGSHFIDIPNSKFDDRIRDLASEYGYIAGSNAPQVARPMGNVPVGSMSYVQMPYTSLSESKTAVDLADTHNQIAVFNLHGMNGTNGGLDSANGDVEALMDHINGKDNTRVITFSGLWDLSQQQMTA